MAQLVKNLPEIWETWVLSLSWEDPLEEDMVTHSSILTGESSWTEEPRGLQFMVSQRIRYDWATKHIQVKEANLKRLPTIWFSLYDILGKAKLWRQWKDKWLPGARGEVGISSLYPFTLFIMESSVPTFFSSGKLFISFQQNYINHGLKIPCEKRKDKNKWIN